MECLSAGSPKSLYPPASIAVDRPWRARDDDAPADESVPLEWRAHDRTHLELPIPIEVTDREKGARYAWEAYFFVPESFRLDEASYTKAALDADFNSYVRFAVPETRLNQLQPATIEIERGLERGPEEAVVALRLFGCRARRVLLSEIERLERDRTWSAGDLVHLANGVHATLARFREMALSADDGGEDELAVAVRWVDEDLSLNAEAFLVRLGKLLAERGDDEDARKRVVELALTEARYRHGLGYAAVVTAENRSNPSSRDLERLEFRRHTLKRFTASVLWLDTKVEDPARWAKQALYALAAGFAMAFAVLAAIWNGPIAGRGELGAWLVVAVVAYAAKDRIKASLQNVFAGVLSRHFADRRWRIFQRDGERVGFMDQRSGFKRFDDLPEGVLEARRMTRQHPIEEEARPETVLWHNKAITVAPGAVPKEHAGLLEIFRVDLRRWLVNTDEANNAVLFADPSRGCIDEVKAPRVYNVAVVYRLVNGNPEKARWRRARVVVTRKGIRRIETIS